MHSLFIYCAGGFGREMMDVARRYNAAHGRWQTIDFIDDICDAEERYGARVFRLEAVCERLAQTGGEIIIASGEPAGRASLRQRLAAQSMTLGTLVDASSLLVDSAAISPGLIVAPLCSISSDARIETNVAINTMSIVGHDVFIDEDSVISSMVNIGGKSRIGKRSYIGMGTLIKEGVTIGDDVIVGMGSVVYNDIPDGVIALGNPARPMRPNTEKKVFK